MPIKFADISWPTERRYWLVNARVPACMVAGDMVSSAPADGEGVVRADLLIEGGKLAETWLTLLKLGSAWPDAAGQEHWTSKRA